jgi:hypothetical protein
LKQQNQPPALSDGDASRSDPAIWNSNNIQHSVSIATNHLDTSVSDPIVQIPNDIALGLSANSLFDVPTWPDSAYPSGTHAIPDDVLQSLSARTTSKVSRHDGSALTAPPNPDEGFATTQILAGDAIDGKKIADCFAT